MVIALEKETVTLPDISLPKRLEVAGILIKCIASNIRKDLNWEQMELRDGLGQENDVVAVEVSSISGSRTQVENQSGRDEGLYIKDRFLGVLANRHSGTSESGDIPENGIIINKNTVLHLLSAGGVIGKISGIPPYLKQEPLCLKPLGLVYQDGKKLNLYDLCCPQDEVMKPSAPIILICGTSAEVGKTTTASTLVRALRENGIQGAGVKFAGTGRMRDILSLRDAGASPALDFPDVGLATTYTTPEKFTKATYTLFNRVNAQNPSVIIAEAGGDPIEANIPTFLSNKNIMQYVDGIIIVAGDVMGMMGTHDYLRRFTDAPIFFTIPKGRNPVTTRERVKSEIGLPVFDPLNIREAWDVLRKLNILSLSYRIPPMQKSFCPLAVN